MSEGELNITSLDTVPSTAQECFERGMIFSSGRDGAVDMVRAHMWFNIAAMRGNTDAAILRREIAQQMSDGEIGVAQKAARDWLKSQPELPVAVEPMRAAA